MIWKLDHNFGTHTYRVLLIVYASETIYISDDGPFRNSDFSKENIHLLIFLIYPSKSREERMLKHTPWMWLYNVNNEDLSGGTYIEDLFSNLSLKGCILYINKTYFLYKGRRSVKPMARKILQYYDNSFKR